MLTSATPSKGFLTAAGHGADQGLRTFDPFQPLADAERQRQRAAYLAHLRQRDGEIDFPRRRLPRREERMRELEANPLEWRGEMDRDAFYQYFHRVGKPEVDAKTLWLVAIAAANEGERFGADHETRRFDRLGAETVDPIKLHHVLQEEHHTRLLLEACRCLGLRGLTLKKPKMLHQIIIHAMTYLPDRIRYVLILCGEVVGLAVFRILLESCRFFPEFPRVEERLRSILGEIIHDESLHVAYCRMHLDFVGLRVARALIPVVTTILMRDLPLLRAFGFDRAAIVARLRAGIEIPEGVDWLEPAVVAPS